MKLCNIISNIKIIYNNLYRLQGYILDYNVIIGIGIVILIL